MSALRGRRRLPLAWQDGLPALGHGMGVWLAAMTWTWMAQHVLPGQAAVFTAGIALSDLALVCVAPAALGAAGFAIGLRMAPRAARRARPRALGWRSVRGGLLLTLAIGVLLPLLAAMQAGPWPVVAGGVVGSAILSRWSVARSGRRPVPRRRGRAHAA